MMFILRCVVLLFLHWKTVVTPRRILRIDLLLNSTIVLHARIACTAVLVLSSTICCCKSISKSKKICLCFIFLNHIAYYIYYELTFDGEDWIKNSSSNHWPALPSPSPPHCNHCKRVNNFHRWMVWIMSRSKAYVE